MHQNVSRCGFNVNRRVMMSMTCSILLLAMLQIHMTAAMAGIDESVRVAPTILKVLDSIAPNSRLLFQAKRGREFVLLGDNMNMTLYGISESYNTNWSWTPKSSKIRYAGIAGVRMFEEGFGECLVGNRVVPSDVYRYAFTDGRTRDSSLLPLPKPAYHIIQNIDAKGNLIAFTALVQTQTTDTLFAYIVDTVSGWHSVWEVPVSHDITSIGQSTIRIMDTSVVVYWQEFVHGKDYRNRILAKGIYSGVELQSVTLSDVNDHRFEARWIATDEVDASVVILAQATSKVEPRFGIQYWRLNLVTGKLESVTEFLPEHTYLTLSDAVFTKDRGVIAVGSVVDWDPTTQQLIQSTSRGFICEYDSIAKLKRFLSMQDQRPSSISSLYQDHSDLLVLGQSMNQSLFVARIDETGFTSVNQSEPGDHYALQHVAWYTILGHSLERPEGGAVIELLQCSHGCLHSKLLWLPGCAIR